MSFIALETILDQLEIEHEAGYVNFQLFSSLMCFMTILVFWDFVLVLQF